MPGVVNLPARSQKVSPDKGFPGGRYWVRTSDLCRVKADTRAHPVPSLLKPEMEGRITLPRWTVISEGGLRNDEATNETRKTLWGGGRFSGADDRVGAGRLHVGELGGRIIPNRE